MNTKTSEDFLVGALIGSAIGIAAALILTPISGISLRNKIANGIGMAQKPVRKHPISMKATTNGNHKRVAVRKVASTTKKKSR